MGNFHPDEINIKTILKNALPTEPTREQIVSMKLLIKIVCAQYTVEYVTGHRDIVPTTACPGGTLYDYLLQNNILIIPEG